MIKYFFTGPDTFVSLPTGHGKRDSAWARNCVESAMRVGRVFCKIRLILSRISDLLFLYNAPIDDVVESCLIF